jgi:hypothetical protein
MSPDGIAESRGSFWASIASLFATSGTLVSTPE